MAAERVTVAAFVFDIASTAVVDTAVQKAQIVKERLEEAHLCPACGAVEIVVDT